MILLRTVFFLGLAAAAVWYFVAEPDRRAELTALEQALLNEAGSRADALNSLAERFELSTSLVARSEAVAALASDEPVVEQPRPIPKVVSGAEFPEQANQSAPAPEVMSDNEALSVLEELAGETGLQNIRVLRQERSEPVPSISPPSDLVADGKWDAAVEATFRGTPSRIAYRDARGAPYLVFFAPYSDETGIPAVVIANGALEGSKSAWQDSAFGLTARSEDGTVIMANAARVGPSTVEVTRQVPAIPMTVTAASAPPAPIGPWAFRSATFFAFAALLLLAFELVLSRRRALSELSEAHYQKSKSLRDEETAKSAALEARGTGPEGLASDLGMIGKVSASIGREINQPLLYIKNNAETASNLMDQGQTEAARQKLDRIQTLTSRIASTMGNLSGFTAAEPYRIEPVSIRPLVHQCAVKTLESDPTLGESFFLEAADGLPDKVFVRADKARLTQVISSLLASAWETCRNGDSPELVLSIQETHENLVVAVDSSGKAEEEPDAADSNPSLSHRIAKSIVEGMGGRLLQRVSSLGGDRIEVILPKFKAGSGT